MTTLNVPNPILQSTDWTEIRKAVQKFFVEYWKDIKNRSKSLRKHERAGRCTKQVSYSSWKLTCQMTISRVCSRPPGVPTSIRENCPGCHTVHKDFEKCMRERGYHKSGMANARLARILLTLKNSRRTDLLGSWDVGVVTHDREWQYLISSENHLWKTKT